MNKNDLEYEPCDDEKNDSNFVKYLDDWKAAAPLKPPFKVLDLEDKFAKYKPKVTK